MTNIKTPAAKMEVVGSSFTQIPTVEEITKDFIAKQTKGKEGSNNYLKDFIFAAQAVLSSNRESSFSFNDFVIFSRHLETPADELRKYYDEWTKTLVEKGRLKVISGAYDYPVHALI